MVDFDQLMIYGSIASSVCCGLISSVLVHHIYTSGSRYRTTNLIVLYIFISDMLSSVGTSFGPVSSGTYECWIQGFLTNIFPLASIFWTTLLISKIFKYLQHNYTEENQIISWNNHLVCWGIPLFLTFIPFVNATYGCEEQETCWCFIVATKHTPSWGVVFWYFTAFFMWLWGGIIVYSCIILYVLAIVWRYDADHRRKIMKKLLYLTGYPLAIIISWIVVTVCDFRDVLGDIKVVPRFAYVPPSFQGVLTSCIYVSTNSLVFRDCWARLDKREKAVAPIVSSNDASNFLQLKGSVEDQKVANLSGKGI